MNNKKLNAGIAFLCLQGMDNQNDIPEDSFLKISKLAEQAEGTALWKEDINDEDLIKQCIVIIQDYLRSVSTDINIGDRVEVLEDNPEDSDNYYDKGEVGVVIHMMDNSCVVNFGQSEWDITEIPFSSLRKIAE